MKHFSFKYLIIISLFFLFFYSKGLNNFFEVNTNQQKVQSLFSGDVKMTGGYTSPYVKKFFSKNGEGLFVGGKAGFMLDRTFTLGGFGGGFISSMKKDGYDLGMGFGGLYGEALFFISSPIHFSFATYVGFGGFGGSKEEEKIRSFGVTVEPELNLEINLTHFLVLVVGGSYQVVFTQFDEVLEAEDFNGVNLNVSLKLGRF